MEEVKYARREGRRARLTQRVSVQSPIISALDAAAYCGVSRSVLDRLESAGQFPARVRLTARRYGYLRTEVEAWLQARADARVAVLGNVWPEAPPKPTITAVGPPIRRRPLRIGGGA